MDLFLKRAERTATTPVSKEKNSSVATFPWVEK